MVNCKFDTPLIHQMFTHAYSTIMYYTVYQNSHKGYVYMRGHVYMRSLGIMDIQ